MSTVQLELPDDVRAVVDEQLASGKFRDHSEYFTLLVRQYQERRRIEAKLASRLSEPSREVTDADFERLLEQVKTQAPKRDSP
jgi:Arc/MetJ-type ribon-helix-helix transcriptional regulator